MGLPQGSGHLAGSHHPAARRVSSSRLPPAMFAARLPSPPAGLANDDSAARPGEREPPTAARQVAPPPVPRQGIGLALSSGLRLRATVPAARAALPTETPSPSRPAGRAPPLPPAAGLPLEEATRSALCCGSELRAASGAGAAGRTLAGEGAPLEGAGRGGLGYARAKQAAPPLTGSRKRLSHAPSHSNLPPWEVGEPGRDVGVSRSPGAPRARQPPSSVFWPRSRPRTPGCRSPATPTSEPKSTALADAPVPAHPSVSPGLRPPTCFMSATPLNKGLTEVRAGGLAPIPMPSWTTRPAPIAAHPPASCLFTTTLRGSSPDRSGFRSCRARQRAEVVQGELKNSVWRSPVLSFGLEPSPLLHRL